MIKVPPALSETHSTCTSSSHTVRPHYAIGQTPTPPDAPDHVREKCRLAAMVYDGWVFPEGGTEFTEAGWNVRGITARRDNGHRFVFPLFIGYRSGFNYIEYWGVKTPHVYSHVFLFILPLPQRSGRDEDWHIVIWLLSKSPQSVLQGLQSKSEKHFTWQMEPPAPTPPISILRMDSMTGN